MRFWRSTDRKHIEKFDKKAVEDLVACAKDGDTKSFAKLYDLFVGSIYRFVYVRIGNRDDAQDIVADTWKIVWLNLPKYKRGNFQGYIFRIAYTTLIGFVRKHKRVKSLDDYAAIPAKTISVEKKLEQKEEITKLYKALEKLPKVYAEIITLRFIDEFSIKETSAILDKSSVMIRVTQHRAMKKLKKLLRDL